MIFFRSPLKIATKITDKTQAGDKYNRAGWAALKVCITTIVVINPKT